MFHFALLRSRIARALAGVTSCAILLAPETAQGERNQEGGESRPVAASRPANAATRKSQNPPAWLVEDPRPATDEEVKRASSMDFTIPQRGGFVREFAKRFYDRFAPMEHRQFRAAIDFAYTLPSHPGDPARDNAPTAAFDPIYRDLLLERRARSPFSGAATSALSETEIADQLREEFRDRRDSLSAGMRTLLGEHSQVSDPLDAGKIGIRGYPSNFRDPGDLLGLTYEWGHFHSRVGGVSATAAVDIPIRGDRLNVGATLDYPLGQANPRAQYTHPISKLTTLYFLGGYGVDSFLIPGNVPYLSDPREERSVGLMFVLDIRF